MTTKPKPLKLKWHVNPAPTGRFKAFEHRSWPRAQIGEKYVARILCADDYRPADAKAGTHEPLKVAIADYRVASNPTGAAFCWRTLKGEFKTLAEAKQAAQMFLEAHPEIMEK